MLMEQLHVRAYDHPMIQADDLVEPVLTTTVTYVLQHWNDHRGIWQAASATSPVDVTDIEGLRLAHIEIDRESDRLSRVWPRLRIVAYADSRTQAVTRVPLMWDADRQVRGDVHRAAQP